MRSETVDIKNIKIDDKFWSKHIDLVRNQIIPYQWDAMNDLIADAPSSHCLDNFRIAAGESKGEYFGAVFQDTDIAKWLETVGYSLALYPDEKLEKNADEVIDLIARAQQPDGYLDTYFIIVEPENKWKNLCEGHELYTAGHMMEAAVAYYQGTGKRKFLDVVMKLGDLICKVFGPGEDQLHGYPGHPEVEIGLFRLYKATGQRRYLDVAKYFIDARGVGENYFLQEMAREDYKQIFPEFVNYDTKYSQSHMPVREQRTAEGHAVRAMYLYCAMADIACETGDEALLNACKVLWENTVTKRMYITGGIGSSGLLERFTTDYDLPNDCNYSESCASIGLALFGLRMAQITGDASYYDEVERALYNTVLAGVALDGKSFFYVNPLEVWPDACMDRTYREHVKSVRQKWFGVACCPPNIARTLASIGQYIYATRENRVCINMYITNKAKVQLADSSVDVFLDAEFPFKNNVSIEISNVLSKMECAIRVPEYAKGIKVYIDGKCVDAKMELSYAIVNVTDDCKIEIEFDFEPELLHANPLVRANSNKVAIGYGPLVYCLEEIDNGDNLSSIYIDSNNSIDLEESKEFPGIITLSMRGKKVKQNAWGIKKLYGAYKREFEEIKIKAIPYAYWNNRGKGEMLVWINEISL